MKKLSFLNKIIFVLNNLAAVALLLSCLACYVSPERFWPLAFFGMGYPFLLLLNILFAIYWIMRWKKQFLLSLIVILLGWSQFLGLVQFHFDSGPENPDRAIKVMSYNVRLFDLYNWSQNRETRNKIFDLIRKESPDVFCLQEIYKYSGNRYFNTIDTLQELQEAKHLHVEYTSTVNIQFFGIATFSKFPIVGGGRIDFRNKKKKSNNICIFTDLQVGEDTIRVYNAHLASIHFGKKDYQFIETIGEAETEEQLEGAKTLLARLKTAFVKRASQVKKMAAHIAASPYPVIVCCDLNDSPSSFAYRELSSGLKDAFRESGSGPGVTYNGNFPAFRIDFLLHSPELKSSRFETLPDEFSDHFPITCLVEVPE